MSWWATNLYAQGGSFLLATWVFWALFSVVLHELAHGATAIRAGDGTPYETGHMTWNPLVHIGTQGLLFFLLIGLPWGMMPVDPSRLRTKHDEAIVALAGPLTNFGLSLISCVVLVVVSGMKGVSAETLSNANTFFSIGAMLNMTLGLLNMMPLYPLDGGRLLTVYLPRLREFYQTQQGQIVSIGSLILVFFLAGRVLQPVSQQIVFFIIGALTKAIG